MNIVYIGKATDNLKILPTPPAYLSSLAKKHYKIMAGYLIKLNRLKEIFLPALEIYSEAMAQFEFASKQIKKKNSEDLGVGYIQKFRSGATNISTEVILKNNAESTLLKCFKQFGLEPKSDKELNGLIDPNQGDLFENFSNKKNAIS